MVVDDRDSKVPAKARCLLVQFAAIPGWLASVVVRIWLIISTLSVASQAAAPAGPVQDIGTLHHFAYCQISACKLLYALALLPLSHSIPLAAPFIVPYAEHPHGPAT